MHLQNLHVRVRSEIISKAIGGSIKNTSLNKPRILCNGYDWLGVGGLIRTVGPTIIYLLFKGTNPATRIGVSNIKVKYEKATLYQINLFDDMLLNYNIIIDNSGRHED